jgi:hypothetical protein
MNRRKAITRILLIGGGSIATYSAYKWWDWNKGADTGYLEHNKNLIVALVETIIPATDSPGAKQAGVQDYIITMVKDCTDIKSQNKFIDGLKDLQQYCSSSYGKIFEQCSLLQQQQTLKHFEQRGKSSSGITGKIEKKFFGESFFTTLKRYTAEGYCTSEAGATKGLSYKPIPGKFIGCMPLQPGQKSWATH